MLGVCEQVALLVCLAPSLYLVLELDNTAGRTALC